MSGLSRRAIIGILVAAIGIAVVAFGLWSVESPSDARRRRLDDRRVADLRQLSAAVERYWTRQGRLPGDLATLRGENGARLPVGDPERPADYEYRPIEAARYELCAAFELDGSVDFWSHGPGRRCFTVEAKKAQP